MESPESFLVQHMRQQSPVAEGESVQSLYGRCTTQSRLLREALMTEESVREVWQQAAAIAVTCAHLAAAYEERQDQRDEAMEAAKSRKKGQVK